MVFDISFGGAALAGLLSFLSPCVLPMVPFYLCYLAGIGMSDLDGPEGLSTKTRRRLALSSMFFALGVTTIFVLLGVTATAAGRLFREWQQELSYLAAAVLIVFGLHFLGVFRLGFLNREARIETGGGGTSVVSAYVMGLAFGFGWTPCVGPALAAILMIASGMGDPTRGGLLLLVYGLGMTLPFVVAALFSGPFLGWMRRNRRYMKHVEKAMGVMLILFGVLIATNSLIYIGEALIRWFPVFQTIG